MAAPTALSGGTENGFQTKPAGGGTTAPLLTQSVLSPRQRRADTPTTQRTLGPFSDGGPACAFVSVFLPAQQVACLVPDWRCEQQAGAPQRLPQPSP
jgi:hypothetical protein